MGDDDERGVVYDRLAFLERWADVGGVSEVDMFVKSLLELEHKYDMVVRKEGIVVRRTEKSCIMIFCIAMTCGRQVDANSLRRFDEV